MKSSFEATVKKKLEIMLFADVMVSKITVSESGVNQSLMTHVLNSASVTLKSRVRTCNDALIRHTQ